MVEFAGTYRHFETDNPVEIIKLIGEQVTDERIDALNTTETVLYVEANGDDYIFTLNIGICWQRKLKFTIGQSFEEGKRKVNTTVLRDGNKLTFVSKLGKKSFERIYQFYDDAMIETINTDTGAQVTRKYLRITDL